MSIISQFFQIPTKSLTLPSQTPQIPPKSSSFLSSNPQSSSSITCKSINFSSGAKREVKLRAVTDDDEWGPDTVANRVTTATSAVAEAPSSVDPVVEEISGLKKQLVELFNGTDRGLKANSEKRAEIVEVITQLEAKNPTAAPTESLPLLNGKWILAYTSFSGLFPLLSRGTLPLVKVEEISQTIDSQNLTVENSVLFVGPLASTSVTTNAKFEVRSPKRVQIKFVEGIIGTPQPTDSIVIPDNVELLGQKIDLSPFRGVLNSVQDTASSVVKTISNQPPLKFNISQNAESWVLTTYLDQELRISRGDAGSVFVFLKEGSPLLSS